MSLEAMIKDLIDAIKENTAALTAAISEDAPAAPAKAEKPAKKSKKVDEEDADTEEDEAEEDADTEEDEAEEDAEDKSDEVLAVAKKALVKNKDAVQAVLAKLKAKKVSDIPAEKHDLAIKLFKAVK